VRELPLLEALPGWRQLKSVKAGAIALANGNLYFNRSGTTIVETVEIIAEILHGNRGADRRHGHAWQPYAVASVGLKPL
jgi:iron complex transport system substrate-binding protein